MGGEESSGGRVAGERGTGGVGGVDEEGDRAGRLGVKGARRPGTSWNITRTYTTKRPTPGDHKTHNAASASSQGSCSLDPSTLYTR